MQLEFVIDGQLLKRTDTNRVIAGSMGYLKAHFIIPEEYTGTISVYFKYLQNNQWLGNPPIEIDKTSGLCDVPTEVIKAGSMYVSLSSTDTNLFIPTNHVIIPIEASGVPATLIPAPGQTNQYKEFNDMYADVKQKVGNAATSEANAAVFAGNAAESATTATKQAEIATSKAQESSQYADGSAQSATAAAQSALTAEQNAAKFDPVDTVTGITYNIVVKNGVLNIMEVG